MKTVFSAVGRILKCVFFCFSALVLFVFCSMFFFEQEIPAFLVRNWTNYLSNDDCLIRIDAVSVHLPKGVRIRNLRVLDRKKLTAKPILSASLIDLRLRLKTLPWTRETILKSVTIEDLHYPRLGDGYYIPDSIEFPGEPDFREKDEPVKLDLPKIAPFAVTLLRPDVLGLTPKLVDLPAVGVSPDGLRVSDIQIEWADTDTRMNLAGDVLMDLADQIIRGKVSGQARQHNIRPMLATLEITNSYPYIDGFTRVEKPIDASCAFDVNLRNSDLHLLLNLHPSGGAYNGVPLKEARGPLDIRVFVRDTYQNARITVGPLKAELSDGSNMSGSIIYENTNDVGFVNFDVVSTATLSNALAIADVLNDGTLDCLVPETRPHITIKGRLAVDPRHAETNDLSGTLAFDRGTFFSIPLRAASAAYAVKGTEVTFSNGCASAPHGGMITGNGAISIPEFKESNASFKVSVEGKGVSLQDLADVLSFDIGDRHGQIDGQVTLSGPLGSNLVSKIKGHGRISCKDGYLSRMRLFAGFTDYLAQHVPGVDSIVTQSNGILDFELENGIFSTKNFVIEGPAFSIRVAGSYNITSDKLNLTARVQLFKDKSLFARLLSPITWTLSEFKIFGTLENPDWQYLHPINRLKDSDPNQ